jgi:hypothetical protein
VQDKRGATWGIGRNHGHSNLPHVCSVAPLLACMEHFRLRPSPVRLTVDSRNFIVGEWLGRDVILHEGFKSQKVQVGYVGIRQEIIDLQA